MANIDEKDNKNYLVDKVGMITSELQYQVKRYRDSAMTDNIRFQIVSLQAQLNDILHRELHKAETDVKWWEINDK